jgi:Transposase DDE domain
LAGEEGSLRLWRGHRLLACDGTYLNLPSNADTRAQFSVQTNQYQEADCVQALCCLLYDLLNDLGLRAALGKRQGEKNLLFAELWQATDPGDVIVFDRGYCDYTVLAYTQASHRDVIVRLPKRRWGETEQFWKSRATQQVITLTCPQTARELVRQEGLSESLRVRLIRVESGDGTQEVLVTTLTDKKAYPASEFKQVYGWRWREETYFDRLKNIFEVERFSGESVIAIKQDFYGVIFLASLESVLSKSDEEELRVEAERRGQERCRG